MYPLINLPFSLLQVSDTSGQHEFVSRTNTHSDTSRTVAARKLCVCVVECPFLSARNRPPTPTSLSVYAAHRKTTRSKKNMLVRKDSADKSASVFTPWLKRLHEDPGPPPRRIADHQLYMQHPDHKLKVLAALREEFPKVDADHRLNAMGVVARQLLQHEPQTVRDAIRDEAEEEHREAVADYEDRLNTGPGDLTEDEKDDARENLSAVLGPLLDDLEAYTDMSCVVFCARKKPTGNPEKPYTIDFKSIRSTRAAEGPAQLDFPRGEAVEYQKAVRAFSTWIWKKDGSNGQPIPDTTGSIDHTPSGAATGDGNRSTSTSVNASNSGLTVTTMSTNTSTSTNSTSTNLTSTNSTSTNSTSTNSTSTNSTTTNSTSTSTSTSMNASTSSGPTSTTTGTTTTSSTTNASTNASSASSATSTNALSSSGSSNPPTPNTPNTNTSSTANVEMTGSLGLGTSATSSTNNTSGLTAPEGTVRPNSTETNTDNISGDDVDIAAVVMAQLAERARTWGQDCPMPCNNIVPNAEELLAVKTALEGLGADFLDILPHVARPDYKLPNGLDDDLPPAFCIAEMGNRIGPLVRAYICNPHLDVESRGAFIRRLGVGFEHKLAREEERLKNREVWVEARKQWMRAQRLAGASTWGGADVAMSQTRKTRKRKQMEDGEADYEVEMSEGEDEDGTSKKRRGAAKRARKDAAESANSAGGSVPAKSRPRPKPKLKEKGVALGSTNGEWARTALAQLTRSEWGPEWAGLLAKWMEKEREVDFADAGSKRPANVFRTKDRPKAVPWWVGRGRNGTPPTGNAAEFGEAVWAWWLAVNPQWRVGSDGKTLAQSREQEGGWMELQWLGPNGFQSFLACLVWWGDKVVGKPQHNESWLALVKDMQWVLDTMPCLSAPNTTAEPLSSTKSAHPDPQMSIARA
uniref:Uncharacterized protein n=1 Tax=Mycena chlorophos TaxID=658473 RepID=A0ABQ0KV87_MYCCL|nr:predicted protein [Mycena chlorophos]